MDMRGRCPHTPGAGAAPLVAAMRRLTPDSPTRRPLSRTRVMAGEVLTLSGPRSGYAGRGVPLGCSGRGPRSARHVPGSVPEPQKGIEATPNRSDNVAPRCHAQRVRTSPGGAAGNRTKRRRKRKHARVRELGPQLRETARLVRFRLVPSRSAAFPALTRSRGNMAASEGWKLRHSLVTPVGHLGPPTPDERSVGTTRNQPRPVEHDRTIVSLRIPR